MLLNQEQIKEIIPHRDPFLLVDEIEEMEPGVRAVGYKNVTGEEGFFRGHFPEYPVMPGVLIVEALAQVGAVSVLSLPENKGKLAFFGGIDKAKFRRQVRPGDWRWRSPSARAPWVWGTPWRRWTVRRRPRPTSSLSLEIDTRRGPRSGRSPDVA